MANPDVGDLHVNTLLTQVAIGYKPSGFYAAKLFPKIDVDKQTDIYPVFEKSHWARDLGAPGAAPTGSFQAVRRAPGTKARTVGYTVDNTNTYRCVNYALGMEIPDELRANADSVFDLDRDATNLLTSLINLRFDRECATDFVASSVWDNTLTVNNKWSDYAAGTPIEDIRAGIDTIRKATLGMSADGGTKLLIGTLVWRRLQDHPDILERIKYSNSAAAPSKVTESLIAQLLDLDEVIVAKSVYTDDEEGTAESSVTYTDVITDDILLYWTPPSGSRMAPSAGYLFNWKPLAGGGMFFTRKGREERQRFDWIEVHAYLDWVATAAASGVYNSDAVD